MSATGNHSRGADQGAFINTTANDSRQVVIASEVESMASILSIMGCCRLLIAFGSLFHGLASCQVVPTYVPCRERVRQGQGRTGCSVGLATAEADAQGWNGALCVHSEAKK